MTKALREYCRSIPYYRLKTIKSKIRFGGAHFYYKQLILEEYLDRFFIMKEEEWK